LVSSVGVLTTSLALAALPVRAQQSEALFRYIALSPLDTITLGRPFGSLQLADRLSPNVYQLKPGTFGGAERIRVLTDTNGLVTVMEFQYADSAVFSDMLKDYQASLGAPTSNDSTPRRHVVAWQDAHTRFELTVVTAGLQQIISTRMIDLSPRR